MSVQTSLLSVQTSLLSVQTSILSVQTSILSVQNSILSVQTSILSGHPSSWRHRNTYVRSKENAVHRSQTIRCCYITVDSATTALQNGACTYQCISNLMHHKTPFSHNGYMRSLELYQNYISLLCLGNKLFDNIIITLNHAWHYSKWLKQKCSISKN